MRLWMILPRSSGFVFPTMWNRMKNVNYDLSFPTYALTNKKSGGCCKYPQQNKQKKSTQIQGWSKLHPWICVPTHIFSSNQAASTSNKADVSIPDSYWDCNSKFPETFPWIFINFPVSFSCFLYCTSAFFIVYHTYIAQSTKSFHGFLCKFTNANFEGCNEAAPGYT